MREGRITAADAVRHAASVGLLGSLVPDWVRSLRAKGRADKTIDTYRESAEQLVKFLESRGMPLEAHKICREHVEAFIVELLDTRAPATAANRFRGIQSLFKWLLEEGEIRDSPMKNMAPPFVPEKPIPVLPDEDVAKLFKTCATKGFEDLRDLAILRVFVDSTLRLAEVANLRYTPDDRETHDVDLDRRRDGGGQLRIVRKGGKLGYANIGPKTVDALARYTRARSRHRLANTEWLFLGRKGRMTDSGIRQMVARRAEAAGIMPVHPHQLRHTAIHHLKAAGLSDELVMEQAGWSSSAMLRRYASSTRRQRLEDSWKKYSPGEKF